MFLTVQGNYGTELQSSTQACQVKIGKCSSHKYYGEYLCKNCKSNLCFS